MTIQEATELCLAEESLFARPISWRGSGQAIDLGCKLDGSIARVVTVLGTTATNLIGSIWSVEAQDILAEWEVVSTQIMLDEKGAE